VIRRIFHRWERRLNEVDTNRFVRPFEWGLDWLGLDTPDAAADPLRAINGWSERTLADSDAFYRSPASPDAERQGDMLRFASAFPTGDVENDTVVARIYEPPPRTGRPAGPRRAIVVLPQWNADPQGHVGLCRLFARLGIAAVRLSLPYHDERRPAHFARAEYIVSSNIGRTLQVNRQAVLDARGVVAWLTSQGYERIGIVGTSLGSCLAMLTMAHEPAIRAGAFNHVSPYFADVVWRGLSTRHVREGLDGHITLEALRRVWMPISPWPFIRRVDGRAVLLVYARYDLTFPVDLSRVFIAEFDAQRVPHEVAVLPCGHYTTAKAPFKYLDGYALARFFLKRL
jgi:pimeloyl-ACP methyl ester carboxylesterase